MTYLIFILPHLHIPNGYGRYHFQELTPKSSGEKVVKQSTKNVVRGKMFAKNAERNRGILLIFCFGYKIFCIGWYL
jgi:hypothetical protein